MYAIIKTGGKQYKVSKGDNIRVEAFDADVDSTVQFDKVLMLNDGGKIKIGTPYIEQATVSGKILGYGRGEKIKVLKFKRRKRYMRRSGHRQSFAEVEITEVSS